MKSPRMRGAAALWMLVCAGAQPALGSPLGAGALVLGIHAIDHAHSVVLESDGGHLDLVLSHGARAAHDRGEAAQDHDHPASFSEGDHVIHITAADIASATPRRVIVAAALASPIAVALPIVAAPVRAPSGWLELRATGVDHLRTVVLRL